MGFGVNMGIRGLDAAVGRLSKGAANLRKREILVIRRAALLTERELKKGLRESAPGGKKFRPLSPMTQLLRQGTKPLIDEGDLLGSIKTTVDTDAMSAFVGVHRTARSSGGADVVNVAAGHEFGIDPFVIPVTKGVRNFFLALSIATDGAIKPLSPNKTEILHPGVPARPFIRPTLLKILPKLGVMVALTISADGGPI